MVTHCSTCPFHDVITTLTAILGVTNGRNDSCITISANYKSVMIVHHIDIIMTCLNRPQRAINSLEILGNGTHFKDSTVDEATLDSQLATWELMNRIKWSSNRAGLNVLLIHTIQTLHLMHIAFFSLFQ